MADRYEHRYISADLFSRTLSEMDPVKEKIVSHAPLVIANAKVLHWSLIVLVKSE